MAALGGTGRVRDEGFAINLGSARTQVFVPGVGVVLDEPTLVAYAAGGAAVAAGQDAWVASQTGPARLQMPVRGGVVRDPVACVHALRLLLRRTGLAATDGRNVAVAVTADASARDASIVAAVVASATGGRVIPVETTLAAAIGAGNDIAQASPSIVCDVGAGVTEMAAIADGHVLVAASERLGIRDYEDDLERAVARAGRLFGRVLQDLPDSLAADAVTRPLLLVGGGALMSELAPRLSEACHMPVHVPDEPRNAVAHGLGHCVTSEAPTTSVRRKRMP
jgi:actin-like ATPase involved in cell morphogenesis